VPALSAVGLIVMGVRGTFDLTAEMRR
jgi:hypothetical protein